LTARSRAAGMVVRLGFVTRDQRPAVPVTSGRKHTACDFSLGASADPEVTDAAGVRNAIAFSRSPLHLKYRRSTAWSGC
jgi:hypothetical protein